LTTFTLCNAVRKFITDIAEYQATYGIALPITTLIESKVREQIMARKNGMTISRFHALSADELLKLLQDQVQPQTKLAFYKILDNKNVPYPDLPRGYKPTTVNFAAVVGL
jgi:hypothetical protein